MKKRRHAADDSVTDERGQDEREVRLRKGAPMIADESVDVIISNCVLNLVRELADSGMTMIIATHEMSFARDVATRAVFMDEGVICEQGSPEEVFDHPRSERTKDFLGHIK